MAPSSENTAIILRCKRDGALIDVLYDALGMGDCVRFESCFAAFDRRRAKRFVAHAGTKKAVLNCKLNVVSAAGVVPLFFSAATSGATLLIFATRARFEAGETALKLEIGYGRDVSVAVRKLKALQLTETASHRGPAGGSTSRPRPVGTSQVLRLVAHDLTNPISGILAASQFLLEDTAHLLDPKQLVLLKSIESSSEASLAFIEDVLELYSTASTRLQLLMQPSEVGTLVAECVDRFRRRAENRRIVLEFRTAGTIPALDLDRRLMTQAVCALLASELESLGPASTMRITATATKKGVEISIAGERILPADNAAKAILTEIRTAPPKPTLNEIRLALTLSAASRIVKAHRGSVRRETSLGGHVFRITLPGLTPAPGTA
jgi:K+-sensing histidine kinase KdpD